MKWGEKSLDRGYHLTFLKTTYLLKMKSGHSVFGAGNPGTHIETVLSVC
jgi:hypothetical protein